MEDDIWERIKNHLGRITGFNEKVYIGEKQLGIQGGEIWDKYNWVDGRGLYSSRDDFEPTFDFRKNKDIKLKFFVLAILEKM